MKRLVLDKFFERIAIEFQLVWLQHFCGSEKAGIYGIVAVDMANKKLLSKVLLTLAAVLMLRQSSDAFVSPGALLAAAVVSTASPAMAEVPTFSVFGFGSGQSDAYSQNDNPINPYSQFSDGTDTVYQARNQDEVDRKKKALTAAFQRFEATPEYIKTKQAQNLRANLLEAGGSLKICSTSLEMRDLKRTVKPANSRKKFPLWVWMVATNNGPGHRMIFLLRAEPSLSGRTWPSSKSKTSKNLRVSRASQRVTAAFLIVTAEPCRLRAKRCQLQPTASQVCIQTRRLSPPTAGSPPFRSFVA